MSVEKCPGSKQDSLISSGNGSPCVFRRGCVWQQLSCKQAGGFVNAFKQGSVMGLAGAVGWFVEKA